MTSGAKKGWPVAQTRPGRPIPGARSSCRLTASNSGKESPGGAPSLHAPQEAVGRVDLPEARVVPSQGLADRLEDTGCGLPKRRRLGESPRDEVLRVQPADRLDLGHPFHSE